MNSLQILLALAMCLLLSMTSVIANPDMDTQLKTKLKELPFKQRVLMLMASKAKPELFNGLPMRDYLFEERYEFQWIDAAFVDLRSLLIHAKKLSPEGHFPEMDYTEIIEFCFWTICINIEIGFKSGNTKIVGAQDILSETEFTPSGFRNSYKVPHMKWSSPGFIFNITDRNALTQYLYRDMHISVDEMNTVLAANYEMVPHLGLQISNLTIDFELTSYINYLNEYTVLHNDGTSEHDGPYISDNAEYVLSDWEYYNGNYTRGLQFRMNCVLSNGHVDPIACEQEENYYDHIGYYKMNVIQLIETLGLASMTRP